VTFDTSRDATTGTSGESDNPFTASSQQVAGYSFRISILNQRDPRHSSYAPDWKNLTDQALQQTTNIASQVQERVITRREGDAVLDMSLKDWEDAFLSALKATGGTDAEVRAVVAGKLTNLEEILADLKAGDPNATDLNAFADLDLFVAAVRRYSSDRNQILQRVARGTIATYEFTNTRQLDNPDLLNHKLIFETDLLRNGKSDFTLNASFSHFSNTEGLPANTKSVRDYQFGAQIDVPIASMVTGPNGAFENWVLTGAWRYMRLLESQKIPLTNLMAPTGVVNLLQGKLTVPIKDGVKVPFAVSWSNRTELVPNKSEVRVNLGVLFDTGVLFSRLNP